MLVVIYPILSNKTYTNLINEGKIMAMYKKNDDPKITIDVADFNAKMKYSSMEPRSKLSYRELMKCNLEVDINSQPITSQPITKTVISYKEALKEFEKDSKADWGTQTEKKEIARKCLEQLISDYGDGNANVEKSGCRCALL